MSVTIARFGTDIDMIDIRVERDVSRAAEHVFPLKMVGRDVNAGYDHIEAMFDGIGPGGIAQ